VSELRPDPIGVSPLWIALVLVLAMMSVVWLASLFKRDASIIDVFWGLGSVVAGGTYFLAAARPSLRGSLVLGLVTLWGVRLSAHILGRNWGKGEDHRYREMRERDPEAFPVRSLFTVFWLQGLLLWAISAPLFQVQRRLEPAALGWLDVLGLGLFAVGFAFEAAGDWQLERFRRDPANAGRVMDRGLWRYTRHPNYFGDALVWWGFFAFAAATPGGYWTIYSPILMTLLLMRVSGVTLLERRLRDTKPAYRDYARRTSAFFPWFPAERAPEDARR
jgi:steroid 5-alpha reductase family enzyme